MERPLTWRHARADTSNFDRGLVPGEGDAVLDLRALRSTSAYGLVAMACLVAHNDRLLAPTTVLAPLDRLAAADLAACGFAFVVHEFLCPVEGRFEELDAALAVRRSAPSRTAWCPEPGGDLVLAVNPIHDQAEEDAAVEALTAGLVDVARAERMDLLIEVLRLAGANRRRHAGTFDAYAAARLVDGGGELAVEIAVGDVGVGLRSGLGAVSHRSIADDAEAVDAVLGGRLALPPAETRPPPWSAAATSGSTVAPVLGRHGAVEYRDLAPALVTDPPSTPEEREPGERAPEEREPGERAPEEREPGERAPAVAGSGPLSRLFGHVVEVGGMVVVRSGTARHGLFTTGTTRAVVPVLRGTIVSCTVPVGRATRMRRATRERGSEPRRAGSGRSERLVGAHGAPHGPTSQGAPQAPVSHGAPQDPAPPACC